MRSNLNRTVPCQIGRSPIQRFLPGVDVVVRNRPAGGDNAAKQPGAPELSREFAACVPCTLRGRASIRRFELDELQMANRRAVGAHSLDPMTDGATARDPISLHGPQQCGSIYTRAFCRGFPLPGEEALSILNGALGRARSGDQLLKCRAITDADRAFDERANLLARRAGQLLDRLAELEGERLALHGRYMLQADRRDFYDRIELLISLKILEVINRNYDLLRLVISMAYDTLRKNVFASNHRYPIVDTASGQILWGRWTNERSVAPDP